MSGADDPASKLVVGAVATSLAFTFFVFSIKDERLLEVIGELLSASFDSGLGDVHGPLVILGIRPIQVFGFGVDATGKLVITSSFQRKVSVFSIGIVRIATFGRCMSVPILVGVAVLFGHGPACFLISLVLFAFLRLGLEDERAELETKVHIGASATGFTVQCDMPILDLDFRLRVLAHLAENKFVDETVKIILKLGSFMRTVDDPAVIGRIGIGLSTKFEAEILDDV